MRRSSLGSWFGRKLFLAIAIDPGPFCELTVRHAIASQKEPLCSDRKNVSAPDTPLGRFASDNSQFS